MLPGGAFCRFVRNFFGRDLSNGGGRSRCRALSQSSCFGSWLLRRLLNRLGFHRFASSLGFSICRLGAAFRRRRAAPASARTGLGGFFRLGCRGFLCGFICYGAASAGRLRHTVIALGCCLGLACASATRCGTARGRLGSAFGRGGCRRSGVRRCRCAWCGCSFWRGSRNFFGCGCRFFALGGGSLGGFARATAGGLGGCGGLGGRSFGRRGGGRSALRFLSGRSFSSFCGIFASSRFGGRFGLACCGGALGLGNFLRRCIRGWL